jgi:hypothetical protein
MPQSMVVVDSQRLSIGRDDRRKSQAAILT